MLPKKVTALHIIMIVIISEIQSDNSQRDNGCDDLRRLLLKAITGPHDIRPKRLFSKAIPIFLFERWLSEVITYSTKMKRYVITLKCNVTLSL
jgi:hypothetical protein